MIGRTFGLYLSGRFLRTIGLVFLTMFTLIYLIDFVEMLRRTSDQPGATSAYVAFLTLLRVPSVSEQVLPFAVLFGAMAAFLQLSRKLELVVARAAGVSAWQFLAPPLLIVALLGVFAATVYNPVAALLKQRADKIEARLMGRNSVGDSSTSLWIRQKSVDGQSILRAERSSDFGVQLSSVTAFVYLPDGTFLERIEAARARLLPGYWSLEEARVLTPGEEPEDHGEVQLASNLSAEQVTQSFVAPDTVPFWDLPELSERMTRAGLDAVRYQLRYQSLLARPLLMVAMVLVAASFSLRFFRFGGVAWMVCGGVAAGFMLYVATKLVGDLGNAGLLSPALAAWAPAIVGSMLGALALLHQEDG